MAVKWFLPHERDRSLADTSAVSFSAIGLIVLAVAFFSCLDATAKYLSQSLPALQIVWLRFVSHTVCAFFLFKIWRNPAILRPQRSGLQVLRSLCLLGTTIGNFMAVQHLQLAQTVSIMFAAPFVVTILSGLLLGEWAGPRRWAAIVVGFIGVLIVTRPGSDNMSWAVLYSLGAMLCYAAYTLLTRILATTSSSVSMLVISAVIASLLMTPVGLHVWVKPPDFLHWALLMLTGVLGGVGHWLFIVAHRLAPAPVLAPFSYVQIVSMIGLGYLVFGDVPDSFTILGAFVIVGSGLFILYREQIRKK